jgi:hypothetical protein
LLKSRELRRAGLIARKATQGMHPEFWWRNFMEDYNIVLSRKYVVRMRGEWKGLGIVAKGWSRNFPLFMELEGSISC